VSENERERERARERDVTSGAAPGLQLLQAVLPGPINIHIYIYTYIYINKSTFIHSFYFYTSDAAPDLPLRPAVPSDRRAVPAPADRGREPRRTAS